jgi:glycosyltransferase involved in cell wall biosynthesis
MKIRILFIITGLSTGGAEMMLLKLLERLSKEHFEAHVISLTTLGELAPRIASQGIPVEAMEFRFGLALSVGFVRLFKRIRSIKPDIVHTWMYHADAVGGLAARLAGVKKIVWCLRNGNMDRNFSFFSRKIGIPVCSFLSKCIPDKIITCSQNAMHFHVKIGYPVKKMALISNGFDLTRYKPDSAEKVKFRAELGVGMQTNLVGIIGRFHPMKNHVGFLEAASLLSRKIPDVHFVFAGAGLDEGNAMLMEAAERNEVKEKVHLLGLRNDVPFIMSGLDIVVSSSSSGEAFPNVLGEAMASGVPCAVTDVGDSAYIVGDTGEVVAPGDMPGLAAAIEKLLRLSPIERTALGERARERVKSHFEIGEIALKYESFYRNLPQR